MKRILVICAHLCFIVNAFAQTSSELWKNGLRVDLEKLAERDTVYSRKIDVSVNNFSVAELVKGLAISNGLSIDVNFDKSKLVTCNFIHQPIIDVLYFLCAEKEIDADIIGNIITLVDYTPSLPEPDVNIKYDRDSLTVSFDFTSCRLDSVARHFAACTGVNLIVPNSISGSNVSAFGVDMLLDDAVQTIAMVNGLCARQDNGRDWILYKENRANPPINKKSSAGPVVVVYPMKYRTVDKVIDLIPAELKKGVEIKTFHDLNSVVLSGDAAMCDKITAFLNEIDKSVKLISIDVIIVDATVNNSQKVGLGIGVGDTEAKTKGSISPGLDLTLNAESLNRILGSFSGLGSINLGTVTSLFYTDLQLLEDAGKIVLRSTPRLATLNGHKATLKSGEVKYYKESQVNIIGTQNPLQSESYLWKNVEASFVLDIMPHVSQDSTITMNINLSQDDFTTSDEDDKYAPPGISKRSFTSIIKVKNGEMVLLGGIEKNLKENMSKGLPFISRVPFLRSIFGKTRKVKTDSKLNIFIKPTIIQ